MLYSNSCVLLKHSKKKITLDKPLFLRLTFLALRLVFKITVLRMLKRQLTKQCHRIWRSVTMLTLKNSIVQTSIYLFLCAAAHFFSLLSISSLEKFWKPKFFCIWIAREEPKKNSWWMYVSLSCILTLNYNWIPKRTILTSLTFLFKLDYQIKDSWKKKKITSALTLVQSITVSHD